MRKYTLLSSLLLGTTALVLGIVIAAPQVNAVDAPAGNTGGQALEIAPPVVNLSANPGETVNAQIKLRDIANGPLIVSGQVNDFTADGEDGTPKILLDETEPNPYSLKAWVAQLPELTLQPRQVENLPVSINIPTDAAPGGYYGVIRFTATPPELKGQGVSLSASLGALVLLTVKGDVKEKLSIETFSTTLKDKPTKLFESTPVEFNERIKNSGNIYEQPAGQIVITDMFGKEVAAINVNLPPRNILPQSIRKFTQKLDSSVLGTKKLFGLYHAQLHITYGPNKQTLTSNLDFWVIPWKLIIGAIIGLIIAFFVIRHLIKRYNRHIIKQASKARRK